MLNKSNQLKGFSILEMLIAVAIGSVLIIASMNFIQLNKQTNDYKHTEERMDLIQNALRQYVRIHQKLPCPAAENLSINHHDYGKEIKSCHTNTTTGLKKYTAPGSGGIKPENIIIKGTIPILTIGLDKEHSLDAWGNQISYALNAAFTQNKNAIMTFPDGHFNIDLKDDLDRKVINATFDAPAYIMVSYGRRGIGAHNAVGIVAKPCSTGTTESDNCTDNAKFIDYPGQNYGTADYYDDVLRWDGHMFIKGILSEIN